MGDPKRIRKKYKTPRQPFARQRIEHDLQLVGKYGLRNMKSVWKFSTLLRHFRVNARRLLSLDDEDRKTGEIELLGRLQRMGLVAKNATLDDVLSLQVESFLERRLQTLVHKKGFATTSYHSRQMIVHGHISIGDRIANSPNYLVPPSEENSIVFTLDSPYRKASHKALPTNVNKSKKPKEARRQDRGKRGPPRPKPKKREPIKQEPAKEEPLLVPDETKKEVKDIKEEERVKETLPPKIKDEI